MPPLADLLAEIENDPGLVRADAWRERYEALDRLEVCLDEAQLANDPGRDAETRRARKLAGALEAASRRLSESIRADIRAGHGRERLLGMSGPSRCGRLLERPSGESYDALDMLVAGTLRLREPGAPTATRTREMVAYQPTPARHALELIKRLDLGSSDVLVDLGSGLGHVPLLASIASEATCVGIELEGAYVDSARECARELGLSRATFVQQDVRTADLSRGSVFYLFTPFTGDLLREVLELLRAQAAQRPIRICTLGPCTPVVAEEPWLEAPPVLASDRIAVFASRT